MKKEKNRTLQETADYYCKRAFDPYGHGLDMTPGKNGKWCYAIGYREAWKGWNEELNNSKVWPKSERRAFMWGYRRGKKAREKVSKA